jgi:hypothetical protein
VVFIRQVRSELSDARQMKATVAKHFQKDRIPPRGSRRGDSLVRFVLREVQHVGCVREHRRASLPGIQPPLVNLADLSDEIGLDPSGA